MTTLGTVLCPVDFSSATERQVELAVALCRAFDARLVLHHNVMELAIGAGVGWMWATNHPDDPSRAAQQKVLDSLRSVPDGIRAEVRLTQGPVADAVLAVARDVGAGLVVMPTRGSTGEDDEESVTARVIGRAAVPVLALHVEDAQSATLRFSPPGKGETRQAILVPTDLTPASLAATDLAFDLARKFAFDVHLLYVLGRSNDSAAEDARRQMAEITPEDLPGRAEGLVETGEPAAAIARTAERLSVACIVMGEHVRGPVRRWFRRATSVDVLHRAPCPIWYVPDQARVDANLDASLQHDLEAPGTPGRLVSELRSTSFGYWPASFLYVVIDDEQAAEEALEDLVAAGVPKDHIRTLFGPSGKETIDPTGEHHSRATRLWRALERATPERELIEQYAEEAEQGHVCIGVRCGSVDARDIVAGILRRHGARLLSYFSIGSVERLTSDRPVSAPVR